VTLKTGKEYSVKTIKTVRLDVPLNQLAAPIYRRFGVSKYPRPAYLQLDPASARSSYGWSREDDLSPLEINGRLFRWSVPATLRGDHSVTVAETVRPFMQIIQDGYSEHVEEREDGGSWYVGRLSASALEAKSQLHHLMASSKLIDNANPRHVAKVLTPNEFIRERIKPNTVSADATNAALELACRESMEEANDEGIFIDGSLIDALTESRDRQRELQRQVCYLTLFS
jgi:hypothetical protein